jgi:hypothetical protein
MRTKQNIQKLCITIFLMLAIHMVYAAFSFTGIADEHAKNSKFSLK